ncbi:MAG: transposase [Eubacteriales bacterium]|nr:transposase [Eubacteriales bacterium]
MGLRSKNNTKWLTNVFPRLAEIRDWCLEGKTNEQMCELLGISQDSWYTYMKEHEELNSLVYAAKSVIDSQVENAVLKSALGFEYEEIKTIIEEDRNGKKRTRIEKVKRYMPPNASAQAFWLRNRKKEEWGDKKEIIIDTTSLENKRKQMFLDMIDDKEIIEAEFEVEETVDDGFIMEDSFDYENNEQ